MKHAILAFVIFIDLTMVFGAPMLYQDVARARRGVMKVKRSSPGQVFTPPCAAAAASSPLHAVAPPAAYHFIPTHERYASYPYNYESYYRTGESMEEPEILTFSDMDQAMTHNVPMHVPMSRSYGVPYAGHYGAPASPSLGVFPGAAKSGCGIPLLFSCTPSIVQGHLGQAQPSYTVNEISPLAASGHPSYRQPEYHQYAMENPTEFREAEIPVSNPAKMTQAQEQTLPEEEGAHNTSTLQ